MDAQLDAVIQDLQGAILLANPVGRVSAEREAWRAHPLRASKTDATAEPKRPRVAGAARRGDGDEIEDGLDPMLQRLEP